MNKSTITPLFSTSTKTSKTNNPISPTPTKRSKRNLKEMSASTEEFSIKGVRVTRTGKPLDCVQPVSVDDWFRIICSREGGEETLLQFYPYKVKMTNAQEQEARNQYGDQIDFDKNVYKYDGALYFRFENDAILARLCI